LLASVVITNHNYGRFLGQAIDSALDQEHPDTELIVVDDGSTDDSRAILAEYGTRITVVHNEHRGQGAGFNDGFAASRGEVVCFLDSDDVLLPAAIAAAVERFDPGVSKVHWPLWEIDVDGRRTGATHPDEPLSRGDLKAAIAEDGPYAAVSPPTSGNAFSRALLERVLPLPEATYDICPDAHLCALAPLFGRVEALDDRHGLYRVHSTNFTHRHMSERFLTRLERNIARYESCCAAVARHCPEIALDDLIEKSWLHRCRRAVDDLGEVLPAGATFLLVDEETWAAYDAIDGRVPVPFPELAGRYGGRPADDASAIHELERLRSAGGDFLAIAWDCFWWLDHYSGWRRHLASHYSPVLENERLRVFDLRT